MPKKGTTDQELLCVWHHVSGVLCSVLDNTVHIQRQLTISEQLPAPFSDHSKYLYVLPQHSESLVVVRNERFLRMPKSHRVGIGR